MLTKPMTLHTGFQLDSHLFRTTGVIDLKKLCVISENYLNKKTCLSNQNFVSEWVSFLVASLQLHQRSSPDVQPGWLIIKLSNWCNVWNLFEFLMHHSWFKTALYQMSPLLLHWLRVHQRWWSQYLSPAALSLRWMNSYKCGNAESCGQLFVSVSKTK